MPFARFSVMPCAHAVSGIADVMVAGNASSDEAKMTGMTPPVFTFRGMWVLVPPYIRRPTTRFAYCTVTRRCPRSMNTTAPMTRIIRMDSINRRNSPIWPVRS